MNHRIPWLMRGVVALCIGVLSIAEAAAGFTYGVGTHFGQERESAAYGFAWISRTGLTSIRDEVYWKDLEGTPGEFDPNRRAKFSMDALEQARARGLEPLVVLGYGNKLYDNASQPTSDEAIDAFANYAVWLVSRLGPSYRRFEIWNEWNIGAGTNPPVRFGDPKNYVKLVSRVYSRIKQVNPNVEVIAGALGDDWGNWPWFRAAVAAGLLQHTDAISAHVYNFMLHGMKGGSAELIQRTQQLAQIIRASRPDKVLPIYLTEVGWPTMPQFTPVDVAAQQAARFLLEIRTIDSVRGVWLYELKNGGHSSTDREKNFGLLNTDYSEKSYGCLVREVSKLARDSELKGRVSGKVVDALMFERSSGARLMAVWNREGESSPVQSVTLNGRFINAKPVRTNCGTDLIPGNWEELSRERIRVQSSSAPTLIELDRGSQINSID